MATQLTVQQQRRTEAQVVVQTLGQMAPQLKAALPAHVSVEKFTRVAANAIQGNPDLLNADRASLFQACLKLAADGLMPDGRDAAIVVFGGKAQAMPMIAGILRKVRQSGEVAKVSAQVVHKADSFTVRYGFDEEVEHIPPALDEPRGPVIGAYATAVLKDGSRLLEVMSLEQIDKVRKVSRASGRGPWVDWFDEMARKTVMRRLSKRLPMSSDREDDPFDRDETMAGEPIEHAVQPKPVSRLDAIEQQFGGDDHQEGRTDEQHGDQFDGSEVHPGTALADELIARYQRAEVVVDVSAADRDFAAHAEAMLDDDVTRVQAASDAAKKRIGR